MLSRMDKDRVINDAVEVIRAYLGSEYKILLFGSWAKGDALETSDIDIGVLGNGEVPWGIMRKIRDEIEEIPTLRKIDVVDLQAKGEKFKEQVLSYARSL